MATTTTPLADRPTYKLVASRLGMDPVKFVRDRRSATPPVSFVRIRDEMMEICNRGVTDPDQKIQLTHEIPRRWLRIADATAA